MPRIIAQTRGDCNNPLKLGQPDRGYFGDWEGGLPLVSSERPVALFGRWFHEVEKDGAAAGLDKSLIRKPCLEVAHFSVEKWSEPLGLDHGTRKN